MAYVINDSCISCGTCAGNCPVSAISEGDGQFVIDGDTCISCGACGFAFPAASSWWHRRQRRRGRVPAIEEG